MSDTPFSPDPNTQNAAPAPREPWARRLARMGAGALLLAAFYGVTALASLHFFMRRVEAVAAPDFFGFDVETARARALAMGLDVIEARRQASEIVPEGSILGQSPEAGFPVKPGQSVTVVVSSGPPRTEVPEVTGMPLASAQETLRQSRLTLKTLYRVHEARVEQDIVLAQEPPAGTETVPDAGVTLVVGAGALPKEYLAGHMVGLPLAVARRAMERSGFPVRIETRAAASPQERGMVVAQYPLGGTLFRHGDAVTLTVGQ